MTFERLPISDAWLVCLEPKTDDRGHFSRSFCAREFAQHGLVSTFVQSNICYNNKSGIVRGMHYQLSPHAEVKLVRCIQGGIHDVIVDLRPESPSYLANYAVELNSENGLMLYVPEGVAHGYQSLTVGATVLYMVSQFYAPDHEGGVRFDDPAINIQWPLAPSNLSVKDCSWPLLNRN